MAKTSRFSLGLVLGAIAGAVAGLFISEKPGKSIRSQTKSTYKEIRKILKERDTEKALKEIFGKASGEGRLILRKAKDDIAMSLSDLKVSVDKIEKGKYKKIVSEVVTQAKRDHDISDATLKKIRKYLEEDYKKFVVKKSRKKAAKKGKRSSRS